MWLRFLALACLVGAAFAGPVQRSSENRCAKQCHPSQHPKIRLIPGNAYVYIYRAENNISVAGSQKEKVTIEGKVEIHSLTPCESVLKIKNIRIQQDISQDEKDDLKRKLELPLNFALVDGKFEQVCPSSEESKQSLNIKKSIISSLVNELPDFERSSYKVEENDSFGKCHVKYTVQNHNGEKVISKEKNLKSCTNRPMVKTSLFEKKISPFMIFEYEHLHCKQYFDIKGGYKQVYCQENQKLRNPLKDRETLKFSSTLKLHHIETKSADKQSWQEPVHREKIQFCFDESREGDRNIKEVERILKSICSKNDKVIDMAIGKDYIKLQSHLKSLSYEQLHKLYESLKDGTLCNSKKVRSIFADALAAVANDACIKLMVQMMANNDVTEIQRKLWTLALTLKGNPTRDTVAALIPLLKKDQSKLTLIAVATLVHKLCASHDCRHISAVNEIAAILSKSLGPKCSSDDDQLKHAVLTAFGNMGYHGKGHDEIMECLKSNSQSQRIRLAAADSFRQLDSPMSSEVVQMLSDRNVDHEIKIRLFPYILRNADERQLRELKRIAEREHNEQVSSYMDTCIQNMNTTQSPRHQNIKRMLQNYEIQPKKGDFWKSKNFEHYYLNKATNIGVGVDADVVFSDKTKAPISFRTRLDGSFGDKNLEMAEFGMQTEGVAEILQNLLHEVKDKLPKVEKLLRRLAQKPTPTLEELIEELKELFPDKNVFGDRIPEVSWFARAFGYEIMSMSTSELSGRNEMLKIAEFMNKLAHGKDADFSHSVVFLNSKLIVPSCTGRSFSIDLAGSSTVGLTARAKVDILDLPRRAAIHIHTQPSMSLEFSTSCGLESATYRPSVKHVSRVHFESDVAFKVDVKDGCIARARMTFPSENIASVKMSTDVVEIDREHNEKSVFQEWQNKIDYHFDKLEKPLGVTAYARVQVPKPWVVPRFPYIVLAGNAEVTLKATDIKSYEVQCEIPKQVGPNMKFIASFDTPGSKVSRRFEAVAEVKQQRDKKEVSLQLNSPFNNVGGSGSLRKNDRSIEGSLELHASEKQIASTNFTYKITPSRSRSIHELSGTCSILNQEPARVDGTVIVTKGRKNQVNFDIKSNKPQSKPLTLKGTIVKDGQLKLSQESEWKFSSDVSLQTPMGDVKLSNTLEKQSKQLQAISAKVGIDYQLTGQQKHSLTISGTSQKSSNKINTNVKLESTQRSKANVYLTWDMQRDSNGSLKNDIKLKYGEKPDKTYIQLKQRTRIPKTGPGYCSTILDIPHRDIHYELNVGHHVDLRSETPIINIEVDLCHKQDKHIKGIIDLKCESKSPLKAYGKVEFESGHKRYTYEDEIHETGKHVIEGTSKFTYTKGKVIKVSQIHYKWKKLNSDSKVHHEIESSIQTPSSRSPITSKASIVLDSESMEIVGNIGPDHSVQAHLKQYGISHFNIELPMIEGNVNVTNKGTKKTIKGDLKTKSRRIILSALADLGDKKHFEIRVQPDVDRAPEKRIIASIGGEKKSKDNKDMIEGTARLTVLDLLDISLVESGEESLLGDHESTLKVSLKNHEPHTIRFVRKAGYERGLTTVVVSRNNVEKMKFELAAGLKQTRHKKELSVEISLTSQDHSFEDTHVYVRNIITRSGSTQNIQTTISFKKNDRVYKTEWNSDLQPNGLEVKAQMQTPHVNYEKNAVGFSVQVSDSSLSSSVNFAGSNNKKISIRTEIETRNHRISLTSKVSSEDETLAALQVSIDNHSRRKSFEASVDANNKRVCEIQGRMRKSSEESHYEGSVKISNHPEIKFRGLNVSLHSAESSALLSANVKLSNNEKISLISEIKEQGDVISATTTIATPHKNMKAHISIEKHQESKRSLLSYIDVDGGRKGDIEITITSTSKNIEIKARSKTVHTPEISAHIKGEKTGESFLVTVVVMKGTSPLLSTSFNRLSYNGGEKLLMKTKTFEDTLLDLEISKEVSGKNEQKYSLKAEGPFPPVHLTISRIYNKDKKTVNIVLRGCRLGRSEVCYVWKGEFKPSSYRIDLEKSVGGSNSHALGSLQALFTPKMSKVTVERNGKVYGIDYKLHRRQHDNDRCSIEWNIYSPSRTSKIRASILHNERQMNLEAYVIPNADNPHQKLFLELKKGFNPDNHETSGYIKMGHPRMSQPLLLTGKVRPVGPNDHTPRLYYGRLVLHSGPVWDKTLVFEAVPNIEQEAYGIRSMEYKVYTDDKSIDAYLKLNIQNSKREKKIGYEWRYTSHDDVKKGGLTLTFHDKNGSKHIKISFSSPSADYEVEGSVAEGPNDINFSVQSNGRKLKEISIKVFDSCAVLEFRKSAKSNPEFKTHICVYKQEEKKLQLLKVDVQYRQHNCVNIRVSVNPENPDYVDVIFKYNEDESCRALKEKIRHLLEEIQRQIKQVVRQSRKDVREPLRSLIQRLKNYLSPKLENLRKEYSRRSEEVKQYIQKLLHSAIPTPVKEAYQKHYKHICREATKYYEKAKAFLSFYWPPICEIGWYCNDIKAVLKNFDAKEAQKLINRKVDEIKEYMKLKFRFIYPSDVVNYIKSVINDATQYVKQKIIHVFGNIIGRTIIYQISKFIHRVEAYVVQYAKKVETDIRQKIIDYVDAVIQKIRNIFSQDEDLQTAKHLVEKAKDEIVNAWRNKEDIANSSRRKMETSIKENWKNIRDEQFQVVDSEKGEYRIKVTLFNNLLHKLRELIKRIR